MVSVDGVSFDEVGMDPIGGIDEPGLDVLRTGDNLVVLVVRL